MSEIDHDEPIETLTIGDSTITILGTAHVSKKSAHLVTELLDSGDYSDAAIELCESRFQTLQDPQAMAKMDLLNVLRSGKAPMVIASLALGAFQQRLADQFGIKPGAEMRAAIDSTEKNNQGLHLIDRDIGTTMKRVYQAVPWYKRMMIFSGLIMGIVTRQEIDEEEIEKLKEGDMLETAFQEFAEKSQDIYKPLIDERDKYMAARVYQIVQDRQPENLLAIVGAGHLKGMKKYLQDLDKSKPANNKVKDILSNLMTTKKGKGILKWIPWLIVLLVMTGFYLGFKRSPELGWSLVLDWVLINGAFTAIGAMIARAHPVTIFAGFIGAPLTSLNPTVGAGMVTAAVELYFRKPTVEDFAQLKHDTVEWRGWWKNRVSRVFLVFFLCTLGSAVGTYVAGFKILGKLAW